MTDTVSQLDRRDRRRKTHRRLGDKRFAKSPGELVTPEVEANVLPRLTTQVLHDLAISMIGF